MSRKWRNTLIGVLVAALVVVGIWLLSRAPSDFKDKYEGVNLSSDVTGIGRSNTYDSYVAQYADMPAVTETIEVDLASFEGKGGSICADGVMTEDESDLTWKVEVPKAGLYNIRLEYLTTESRGVDIEREIAINGELATVEILKNKSAAVQNKKAPVALKIDKKTPYEKVAEVLDVLQMEKIYNIQFVNELKKE